MQRSCAVQFGWALLEHVERLELDAPALDAQQVHDDHQVVRALDVLEHQRLVPEERVHQQVREQAERLHVTDPVTDRVSVKEGDTAWCSNVSQHRGVPHTLNSSPASCTGQEDKQLPS
jgi:hypothetical protein